MPVGLQTWLPGAVGVQFTNEFPALSLFARGTMATADGGWLQEGGNSGYKDVTLNIPAIAGYPVFIALRSQQGTWSEILSRSGASITFRVFLVGSGSVEYLLHSSAPPPANPSNTGLEMYFGGQRMFASESPPALPMGILSESGYAGISLTGRRVAHIPVKMYSVTQRAVSGSGLGSCSVGGAPGYQMFHFDSWTRSAIVAFSGSVSTSNRTMALGPYPVSCNSGPISPTTTTTVYNGFRALIIDVTTITT